MTTHLSYPLSCAGPHPWRSSCPYRAASVSAYIGAAFPVLQRACPSGTAGGLLFLALAGQWHTGSASWLVRLQRAPAAVVLLRNRVPQRPFFTHAGSLPATLPAGRRGLDQLVMRRSAGFYRFLGFEA